MSAKPILEVVDLVKSFGALIVTDRVSLNIVPGELHALIGPNGAGKSTLINQITGELEADSGSIYYEQSLINPKNVSTRARLGISRAYQVPQLFPSMTVAEHLIMADIADSRTGFHMWSEHGFKMPDNYLDYIDALSQMKKALSVLDEGKVACNNDLLAANFIDDGQKIWIIDYEYSGNNDACFELGNIYSESNLSYDQLVELVDSYYGKHRAEKVARAWLYALLARYGWTLWASIQDSISELDFNFWDWGMQKYEVAIKDFKSVEFKNALIAVTQKS